MQRFETKYDILQRAYKDRDIKKGTISLLQYLVMKSNKSNCFPAVDTIAAALGCCRRTVQYNMRKLERAGYIVRKDRWYNHQQLSNQYCFPLDVMEDVPGQEKYTETEYNIMNAFSFTNQQDASGKAAWINKIYQCHNLSKCAKQIMVYMHIRCEASFSLCLILTDLLCLHTSNRVLTLYCMIKHINPIIIYQAKHYIS